MKIMKIFEHENSEINQATLIEQSDMRKTKGDEFKNNCENNVCTMLRTDLRKF